MILHCDFETRSHLQIGGKESVGIDNYAKHKSTEALMMAWAIDEEPVDIWFPGTPMPSKLVGALNDSETPIAAWNSSFERYIFKYVLKRPLPIGRFVDPQASARYLSLPASLGECSWILNLPKELQKDARGEELIDIFSQLTYPRKKRAKKGEPPPPEEPPYFRDEFTDPEAWEEFVSYCFTPDHKLLGSDLIWKAADQFKVGDSVLGFDEEGPNRKFRNAVIEKISYEDAPIFEVQLQSGKIFRVTKEHQWLTCRQFTKGSPRTSQRLRWLRTSDLYTQECRNNWSVVPRIVEPWETDTSYDAGWLAGILDGEGSVSGRCLVHVGQNPGPVNDRIRKLLSKYGDISDRVTNSDRRCESIYLKGGKFPTLRMLGSVRPIRLLGKVSFDNLGRLETRDLLDGVVSIKAAGVAKIIKIQTSTGTLVVDGYPMHNCKQDVVAEREITHRLEKVQVFPLPERERKIWLLDQKINDAGMPVDREFVKAMYTIATEAKDKAVKEQVALTGIEKPNGPKMLPWVRERGYPFTSLKKENVQVALDDESVVMTPECREVLIKRRIAASTSYTKLAAILRQVSDDNRLRHQFIYMGSARCGRWSGNAVQLHNMARPDKDFEEVSALLEARNLIKTGTFEDIEKRYGQGQVLRVVKNCIRSVFVAPEGDRLNVCDLNAIETRVGAWVSNCVPLLDVFANNRDPYLDFAMKMTQIPYETLYAWLKGKDPEKKAEAKLHRQIAKPGVLGCVYRLGGGNWFIKKGDKVRGGLWGYAHNMGIKMSQELAHESVRVFREAYKEICQFWYDCENAIKKVLNGPRNAVEQVGPANCPIYIDKLTVSRRGEEAHPILRIKLPSGRYLHYMDAYLDESIMPWKDAEGGDVYKETFHYSGVNQITHQWEMGVTAHGGKTMENIVQGIARDVLAEVLLRLDALMDLIGHVHDEGLGLTLNDPFSPGIEAMLQAFSDPMPWAPTLPLGADGYEASGLTNFYRKG